MDFIFGTLATDALKVVHHRARHQGIQHGFQLSPRDPQPEQVVTLTVRIGADVAVNQVACYYTLDGSLPKGSRGTAEHGAALMLHVVGTEWDTITWNYLTLWQCELPAQPDGTVVRYSFSGWQDAGAEIFADWPDPTATAERAASAFFKGEDLPTTLLGDSQRATVFAYHVDTLTTPQWVKEAVIYHVFVDRFYPGEGQAWLQTSDLNGMMGGTLWGVRDKLDYIADLGATCIWLSPTWSSPSHHGYDVTDYLQTRAEFGGDEALQAVVEGAHQRGMRVLLDMVCNHISNEHPIFVDAFTNPDSPYRDWFTFDDSELGYRAFFGVAFMPEINLANPAARDWMLDNARYWLKEFGVDGYRLDYANGPGPSFWADFRAACRAVNPEAWCFGEVVDAPDVLQAYIGKLDGCLDFHLGAALRNTYGWGTWTEEALNQFEAHQLAYFPSDFVMPTFIDNHDMDRFLFIAGGDKDALRRAATRQMACAGPPIIYYGTEAGLSQPVSAKDGFGLHVCRTPMLWGDEQDHDLLTFYRGLITQRRAKK
ncbi:MAG: alpha-amylase [Anaerolineales bacterium]|nr:alpha-amylase [Anaerolineales bacterium]